jgi:hypothetical protein
MTTTQVKILVSVFFVLALWRVFELPGVSAAFWAFCTVGAIPGTGRTLSFEVLARSLIGLFTVIILLVFRKEFVAAFPRRTPSPEPAQTLTPVAPAALPPQPLAVRRNNIVVVLSAQADRPGLSAFRPVLIAMGVSTAWTIHTLCEGEVVVRRSVIRAFALLKRSVIAACRYLQAVAVTFGQLLYALIIIFVRVVITLWKLAEPHFRAFDRYLDATLHANKSTAEVLHILGEASKVTHEAYQKAQNTTRKLIENK